MRSPRPLVEIVATGRYLPERVLTNADLEKLVETSDQWITERTGIKERRIAGPEMGAADMGARAAQIAMDRAGVHAGEIDVIILSTATPDRLLPSTACDLQALLGAKNAGAYDISAACSGFIYALQLAEGHIAAGRADIALVVSTEKMSGIVDWKDRQTCVLFGDGAGAAIVRKAGNGAGVLSTFIRSDGELAELLWRPAGGVRVPMDLAVLDERSHLVKMAGREANMRIIEATAKYTNIPMEKVFINIHRYGNMSSATVPVALDEAVEQNRIRKGDHILMVAFGAGFTWASAVVRW
jgi:3-oxoacyl-[acyl-carrier-protein] synthase-3